MKRPFPLARTDLSPYGLPRSPSGKNPVRFGSIRPLRCSTSSVYPKTDSIMAASSRHSNESSQLPSSSARTISWMDITSPTHRASTFSIPLVPRPRPPGALQRGCRKHNYSQRSILQRGQRASHPCRARGCRRFSPRSRDPRLLHLARVEKLGRKRFSGVHSAIHCLWPLFATRHHRVSCPAVSTTHRPMVAAGQNAVATMSC